MATMIPKALADRPDSDIPGSERQIFNTLQTGPHTKSWVVIHSVSVPGKGRKSYPREVDFLIMAPGRGAVCLEVKGDVFDVRDGQWFRRSNGDNQEAPNDQAATAMECLQRYLVKQAKGSDVRFRQIIRNLPIWYAVAFTDAGWPEGVTKPADCEIYDSAIANDPAELCQRLSQLLEGLPLRGHGKPGLTPDIIDFIRKSVKPDLEMDDNAWTNTFNNSLKELVELTEKQSSVLRLAKRNPRVLLEGGSGTGKTVLAVRLAKERAADGGKVALLCNSITLAESLRSEFRHFANVVCEHQLGFLYWLVGSSPVSKNQRLVKMIEETERGFLRIYRNIPAEFTEAAGQILKGVERYEPQFNYLVVDELQDFVEPTLFEIFDVVLEGGLTNGHWTMFGDFANQSSMASAARAEGIDILDARDSLTAMGVQVPVNDELQENCRNSRNIFVRMQHFDASDTPYRMRAGASEGPAVRTRCFAGGAELERLLDDEIGRLCRDGVEREQIVVLGTTYGFFGPDNTVRGLFDGNRKFGPGQWPLYVQGTADDGIAFYLLTSYAGLESDVVIMIVLDQPGAHAAASARWEELRTELYIGLSRAKAELVILVDTMLPCHVKQKLGWQATGAE